MTMPLGSLVEPDVYCARAGVSGASDTGPEGSPASGSRSIAINGSVRKDAGSDSAVRFAHISLAEHRRRPRAFGGSARSRAAPPTRLRPEMEPELRPRHGIKAAAERGHEPEPGRKDQQHRLRADRPRPAGPPRPGGPRGRAPHRSSARFHARRRRDGSAPAHRAASFAHCDRRSARVASRVASSVASSVACGATRPGFRSPCERWNTRPRAAAPPATAVAGEHRPSPWDLVEHQPELLVARQEGARPAAGTRGLLARRAATHRRPCRSFRGAAVDRAAQRALKGGQTAIVPAAGPARCRDIVAERTNEVQHALAVVLRGIGLAGKPERALDQLVARHARRHEVEIAERRLPSRRPTRRRAAAAPRAREPCVERRAAIEPLRHAMVSSGTRETSAPAPRTTSRRSPDHRDRTRPRCRPECTLISCRTIASSAVSPSAAAGFAVCRSRAGCPR